MQVENIVNNLYEYIANNNFNGFYDYLVEILKNSSDEKCNLIVDTFLNNINHDKFYNMYAPVVEDAYKNELNKRKTFDFTARKNFLEEEQAILDNPITNALKEKLFNKDLEGFKETLTYLVNGAKTQNDLSIITSSVGRLVETIKNDHSIYEKSKEIYRQVIIASPLHQERMKDIQEFIDNHSFRVIDGNLQSIKK